LIKEKEEEMQKALREYKQSQSKKEKEGGRVIWKSSIGKVKSRRQLISPRETNVDQKTNRKHQT